jgi:aryl-alcohol dehydrogenase-like predicted oxidoreductase
MKLGIGGAQLGLNYGISNRVGQTSAEELTDILEFAEQSGVEVIDTAPAYCQSERSIGSALREVNRFKIVTKTPRFSPGNASARALVECFECSLIALRQPSVYGLLFHAAGDLMSSQGQELMECAQQLKRSGQVVKVGISVYDATEIDAALSRFDFDLIQLPINIFDQRLLESGHLSKLKKKGIEIHARSVFLQGLLLMRPEELKPFFRPVVNHLAEFRIAAEQVGLTPTRAALKFVDSLPEIDSIICGVNSCDQFKQLVDDLNSPPVRNETFPFRKFAFHDQGILNPTQWQI